MDYSRQHQNINFWRGNTTQNFSYLRGSSLYSAPTELDSQLEPHSITPSTLSTTPHVNIPPTTQPITTNEPISSSSNNELGTPPIQENLETMPSTDSGNWGGGGGYGGGGGAAQPSEEEMLIVEDNKIMGLEPKYFYGGLILLAIVGGYMLKTRNTKAKIK